MLRKLLKYDMKSVWRIWWVMSIGVLGLTGMGAVVLRFVIENIKNDGMSLFMFFGITFLVLCFVGIIGSIIMTYILVYLRFYKHLFTDEGYLTFTLPVKRRTLLLSKTINAIIWSLLHIILIIVCILIIMIAIPSSNNGLLIVDFFKSLGTVTELAFSWGGAWVVVYLFEYLLLIIVSTVFSISLIQFCITLGATIVKRAKVITAIGIYYGANIIISSVTQLFGTFGIISIGNGYGKLLENASFNVSAAAVALTFLVVILMISAITSILYFVTLGTLERRLNLA